MNIIYQMIVCSFIIFPSVSFSEVISLQAEYLVPTLVEEEKAFNNFKLENYQVEIFQDGSAIMEFELPKNMTGQSGQKFQLKLTGKISENIKALSGPQAKAVCEGPWKNMKCSISFNKVKMNKSELLKTLHREFVESEAQNRFNLLMKFGTDPIGLAFVTQN